MIKIFVDSGSSIKKEEIELYNVEVLPLKILLKDTEYLDGVDLTFDAFYTALIDDKIFPKTSLPSLEDAQQRVNKFVNDGYEVIILTISSGISGTHDALKTLFENNNKVRVIDSKTAVGGIKILVKEVQKYLDEPIELVERKLNELIPRIRCLAVPETLDYLHKGGRLSATGWAIGTILRVKPVIELKHGVKVAGKTLGINSAMKFVVEALNNCDTNYPIVPSYTFNTANLEKLISKTTKEQQNAMIEYDNIDPAVAAHWGPNAFGFIFVEKTNK